MLKLKVIVGSTRPGRAVERLIDWVEERARTHGAFEVEMLDLRDWPLPFFQETLASVGDPNDPTYSEPVVKAWNAKIVEADAIVMVTPEYNHSFSAILKNAIDNVFLSYGLRNKPAGLIGYSNGPMAGVRAVEQLALVVLEAEMVPLRNTVLLGTVSTLFVEGKPTDLVSEAAMTVMLDDLAWWAGVLTEARKSQLRPGGQRLRAETQRLRDEAQAATAAP